MKSIVFFRDGALGGCRIEGHIQQVAPKVRGLNSLGGKRLFSATPAPPHPPHPQNPRPIRLYCGRAVVRGREDETQHWLEQAAAFEVRLTASEAECVRLRKILNTPMLEPFTEAVVNEARHQVYRWGEEHDVKKTAWDWFWTLGYLGGKAAQSALAGDLDKAKHHTITAAALLANWHRQISGAQDSPEPRP